MAEMLSTTVYATLTPRHSNYGDRPVNGFAVTNVTQKKPKKATGPVIKLTIRLPRAAFEPLAPEVTIEVPGDRLDYTPTVVLEDPQ